MAAGVLIEPEVTQVTIDGGDTQVAVDVGLTAFLIEFEETDPVVEVTIGGFTTTVEVAPADPVSLVVEHEEITVLISSDIAVSEGGSGGSSFLAAPEELDDSDDVYFYFGWAVVNGNWLVRRQTRLTAAYMDAVIATNAGEADLAAAWALRASLSYT